MPLNCETRLTIIGLPLPQLIETKEKMDPNKALFGIYKNKLPFLKIALEDVNTVQKKISYPLLIHAFPKYQQANVKLFVVGQQTYGWGFNKYRDEYWCPSKWDNSFEKLIGELIKVYKNFHLGEDYYSTPFWRAAYNLYRKLNAYGPEYGFLWSNLVKVDQDQNRPEGFVEEIVCNSFPVLPLEIEVTRPDVVVFFTGPRYDQRLKQTFRALSFDKIQGYDERTLSRVVHGGLPKNSFRTYHPKYLSLSGELEKVIDKITELVRFENSRGTKNGYGDKAG